MDLEESKFLFGNLIYEGGTLATLLFEGGDVSFTKSGTGIHTTYHFYMKDHLGYLRRIYQ